MKSPLTKSWKSSIHEHFIFNTRNHICYMVHDLFPVPTHSQVSSPSFCSGLCLGDQPLLFLSCWLSLIGLVNQKPCKMLGAWRKERFLEGSEGSVTTVPVRSLLLSCRSPQAPDRPLLTPSPVDGRVPTSSPGDGLTGLPYPSWLPEHSNTSKNTIPEHLLGLMNFVSWEEPD